MGTALYVPLVLASLGSGSETGAVNSGSPLTPDPHSLIDCEEEPGPSRRGEQEGAFSRELPRPQGESVSGGV